jgi:hypothetical protein
MLVAMNFCLYASEQRNFPVRKLAILHEKFHLILLQIAIITNGLKMKFLFEERANFPIWNETFTSATKEIMAVKG